LFAALNRDVEEWASLFDEPLLAQSALDRFCHRAHQIVVEGESYRKRMAPRQQELTVSPSKLNIGDGFQS
jgi:DNA replication protein DnaC